MGMLKNGVPSETTLCRVNNGLNNCAMADRMQKFVEMFHAQLQSRYVNREIICVDGKTKRGTVLRNRQNPNIVPADSFNSDITLSTETCQQESNEIMAVPLHIDKLDLVEIYFTFLQLLLYLHIGRP